MAFFSVVIPTYNRARLLPETLASVFAQEFTDFEVLVVDDGSTDDTQTVLARYGERVRVLSQRNQGQGVARNLGIQHATGEYVVFLDSDDLWFPWTLATYRHALDMYGRPAVVMGTPANFHRPEELTGVRRQPLRAHAFGDYFASAEESFARTACIIAASTEALRRVGGFTSERIISEDHDLLYRLGTERGFVWVEAPLVAGYRQHGGSSSRELERGYQGLCYQLEQERLGRYPGGEARKRDRLTLILHGVRHVTRWLVEHKRPDLALDLYRRGLMGHLVVPRWRYVLGFPPWMVAATLRQLAR
ncbi:glycosyltransferase family 2 protein [Hyalangium rubrum]|uniref:Glycosyltransferase family A protein n=1 Tax=Hyalangium rubrum TaxID=3103134 RepID=A0ABU5H0R2_9BACT|nr:glycosyltransferase family A protein [Hyalangium sp. s54d21]MDY7226995.1 glycosyltransferase family A protein [Hyalangium sp. s54d21]